MRSNGHQVGVAGEHFVAYNLARRKINPAMMSKGADAVDILCTMDGSKAVSIQVKSSLGKSSPRQWLIGKHKPNPSSIFFFIFCNIWADLEKDPEIFIIPSQFVHDEVDWNAGTPLFKLKKDQADKFRDAWHLITEQFLSINTIS